MKVLQVSCEGLGNGGVQAVIMGICRHMPDVHYDIILFTSERRYYDDEFEMLGGKIFRIPNYEGLSKFRKKLDYYIRFFRIFMGTYEIIKKMVLTKQFIVIIFLKVVYVPLQQVLQE